MTRPDIISAITTPFTETGALDLAAFRTNLVRLEPVVDAVMVAGTTGEFPALQRAERTDLFAAALDVFGTSRVIAHIGGASVYQSTAAADSAVHAGATRLAAITPYFLAASASGVARHYRAIKSTVGSIALYAYVFPDVAGTDVLPADVGEILDAGIDGLKISGRAAARVADYASVVPAGFPVWSGNDADLPRITENGGAGTISGVSTVCPHPWARYRDAAAASDLAAMDAAQSDIEPLVAALGARVSLLKYGLEHLGHPGGFTRMTIDGPNEAEIRAIDQVLDQINDPASA